MKVFWKPAENFHTEGASKLLLIALVMPVPALALAAFPAWAVGLTWKPLTLSSAGLQVAAPGVAQEIEYCPSRFPVFVKLLEIHTLGSPPE